MLKNKKLLTGIKKEMTQVFSEDGRVIPVTRVVVSSGLGDLNLGDEVSVIGRSKGKGFSGVMKRWNFFWWACHPRFRLGKKARIHRWNHNPWKSL
jgi:ribosomal protein L3